LITAELWLTFGQWIDARFEVLGAPYSLLSVSLSASQKLYTRRGTLVGVSGKAENVSELSKRYMPVQLLIGARHNQLSQYLNLFDEPH